MNKLLFLIVLSFCTSAVSQIEVEKKEPKLELTFNSFNGMSLGPRVVYSFTKEHSLAVEYSNGFNFNFLDDLKYIFFNRSDKDKTISNHKQIAYRFFPGKHVYYQLGYQEKFVSYEYDECKSSDVCSGYRSGHWEGTYTAAVLTVGFLHRSESSRLLFGGELYASSKLSSKLVPT